MEGPEQMPVEGAAPAVVLPQGSILSYFNVNNASRVRTVTVWGMMGAAGLALAEFLWLAYLTMPYRFSVIANLQDLVFQLQAIVREEPFLALLLGAFLLEVVVLMLCGWGVKRFSMAMAITGLVALVPLLISTGLMTVGFCIVAFLETGLFGGPAHLAYLWCLIPGVAGVFVILLLKDLMAFLVWIVKHPGAEKPPVAFLPGG